MAYNNIFAGWGQGPAPSVFGALPSPAPATPADFVTFYLTSFNPSVLNCTVIGPQQKTYFTIITDPNMPTYTVLKDAKARSIGLVEWSSGSSTTTSTSPAIELRGVLSKQKIKEWLQLSYDRSSRTMDVRGTRYIWTPNNQTINLYTTTSKPQLLARVCRGHATITVDVATDAMRMGLLDPIIMATLILQSGKNID